MKKYLPWPERVTAFIGSKYFFRGTVAFLVMEALWIGLTARYPMAFDEDFHLGVIRLYAHHLSPFWAHQPAGGDAFGAVARDPSYLYHYLMSFPYRLISVFTHNQTAQVLLLRAINLALFVSCLPLYRRLLLKAGAPRTIVHLCLAAFVLIPIVPMLAAQINYDNLLLPLTAWILLKTLQFSETLREDRRIDMRQLIILVSLCLLTGIVKYAFLPILLAVFIFTAVQLRQVFPSWRKLLSALAASFQLLGRRTLILLAVLFLLSAALFVERYGINTVRYHTPVPDCGDVLSVQHCSKYGPWIRDYNFSLNKVDDQYSSNPLAYSDDWFYGMWLRLFFAVDGPATNFQTRGPLIVPALSAVIFATAALVALVVTGRRLLREYRANALYLFAGVSFVYVLVLWLDEYRAYLHTAHPVAINGRYLLPVLPLLLVIGGLALDRLLRSRRLASFTAAAVLMLSLFWGGGALTYILRSSDTWYWQAQPVYDANHAVKTVIGPLVPGYRTPSQFLH